MTMELGRGTVLKLLAILLIGLQISTARIISKRDSPGRIQLFAAGDEYKYNYEVLVTTGTEVPISHASSYRIKGILRVQGVSASTVTVKLEDLTIGLYNGQWSYFPVPSFDLVSKDDLNSLSLPFQIVSENGKFKTLIMNDQEPEWASNMKRGLATYLQMNMERVTPQKMTFFKDEESTTLGICPTTYEVLPITATGMGSARVTKFRNHDDCPDIPTRIRHESRTYYPCRDDKTRDIMNSTSYAIYDLSVQGAKVTAQKLVVLSSILYWPFTQTGPFLYSWYNLTISLDNVGPITTPIEPPENSIDHEDLSFVFEQSDYSDQEDDISDLKGVEPLFFHQTSHESEPEVVEKIMEKCHETIAELAKSMLSAEVFNDFSEFHGKTPTAIVPLLSSLDYDSLTKCYGYYSGRAGNSEQESLELQLFLDGLSNSGTPATTLVIRDIILKSTKDLGTLTRLISSFPTAIRHPSEALGNELDPILELVKSPSLDPRFKSMIELAMATLISRSCRKSLCGTSGLLEKYINYFEDKLNGSSTTEAKVLGVLGLGNIGIGRALEKPLEIAQGLHPAYDNIVRIQSIWGLRPLILEQRDRVMASLLPVFFNRSETSEVRTSVFSFLMGSRPDERVLHEIAYTMWSETCPQVINVVVSTLNLMSKTEYPCNPVGSHARTILKYIPFPYQQIDPSKSASYALDYYDKNNGFGRMTFVTMQKTGSSILPLSVYMGLNSYIGGFANSFFGFYIRLQGVEKLVESHLPEISEGNVEKVIEILSKIEIDERKIEPLQFELVIINSGKAVQYIAADMSTIRGRLKTILASVQEAKKMAESGFVISLQHPALTGGVRYQQPLEIGTPVSIFASLATIAALNTNITKTSEAGGESKVEEDIAFQFSVFATTGITNHIPAINTMLSVSNYRTTRVRVPLHSSSSTKGKGRPDAFKYTVFIPPANNPFVAMTHATCEVSLTGDLPNGIADEQADANLKESCPTCLPRKTVTVGDSARRDRVLSLPTPKLLRGVIAQVKYVDCERDHSKAALLKRLQVFLSDSGKNTGHFATSLAKLQLGIDHALDSLFISPYGETCGMKAIFAQDPDANTQTKKVSAIIRKKSSESPPKVELFLTLVLSHEGALPTETKADIHAVLIDNKQTTNKQQQINIKAAIINDQSGQSGIMCLKFDNKLNAKWEDPLAYTEHSDPAINQTITLKIGKFPLGQPSRQSTVQDLPCLTNHAEITFTGHAERSAEQVLEAESPNVYPYNLCNGDKASGLWPGKFIPPTKGCELAMLEQTSLRAANLSISYKVAKEAKHRWGTIGHLAAGLLSPYLVDSSEADSSDHAHTSSLGHSSNADSALFASGDVEISLNLKKNAPQMDLHYSKSEGEERHFHNVDLSLLPPFLVPDPFSARVSPLQQIQRRSGLSASCSISPTFVATLDGWQYPINLSSECSVLVSGDCSRRSQYAILARQMPNQQLAVIIQVQGTRIELQDPTTAVIDGALKTFTNFEEFGQAGKFLMYSRVNEIYVEFTFPHISVRYTGSFITVDLGSMFKGVNCGLCGNWDGNLYNDLVGPKVCPRPLTPVEMEQSWVVREGQCTDVGQNCPA